MRIDRYLKISRLIKRRTVAKDATQEERVFLNGKAVKPSARVSAGDEICIRFGNSQMRVRVLSTPEHASKDGASALYEVLSD